MLLLETKGNKLAQNVGKRSLKNEQKRLSSQGNRLLKECIKVKGEFETDVARSRNNSEQWKTLLKSLQQIEGGPYYVDHKLNKRGNVAKQLSEIST